MITDPLKLKTEMAFHPVLSHYDVDQGPKILNLSLLSYICKRCEGIYCPIHNIHTLNPQNSHVMPLKQISLVLRDIKYFPIPPVLRLLPHGELSQYPNLAELSEIIDPFAS